MFNDYKQISLKGGETFITQNKSDAFRVLSGAVLVYIVPVKNDTPGRRSFIYEASAGEVLPGFCYRDMEYCDWRFCFAPLEQAILEVIENGSTKILKERFATKANIRNFAVEGYNGGLVDQYRTNTVTEDGFILRTQKERVDTVSTILSEIQDAFNNKPSAGIEKTGYPIYDCAALLCSKKRIPIAPVEKIRGTCGEGFGIADIARLSHFSYHEAALKNRWFRKNNGDFIVLDKNEKPFLCIAKGSRSNKLYDPETDTVTRITDKTVQTLSEKAYMICRPLPFSKRLGLKDLFMFCKNSVRASDVVWLAVLTVLTALIGIVPPTIIQKLYDVYVPLGAKNTLLQLGCVMGSFMAANILFAIAKNLVNFKISSGMSYDVQNALYDRLFNLPECFFKRFDAADLAQRVMVSGSVISSLSDMLFASVTALICLVVFFVRMITFSEKLTAAGCIAVTVYAAIYFMISNAAIGHKRRSMELESDANSKMFQFLNGISKIRIAGVEDRALLEYIKPYIKLCNCEEKIGIISNRGKVLSLVSGSIFFAVLFMIVIGIEQGISIGTFVAFGSMFAAFSAIVMKLIDNLIGVKLCSPMLDRLKPILSEIPELNDEKELPGDISGAIEINNVKFSYSPDEGTVLSDVSINIKSGEYVGIVGASGSGKSTLIKLLLGFEKPSSGKIYFDNKDIESMDKRELRKKMGVVLQDGKLISGSIFDNIKITSPNATVQDVEKAIAAAGLDKDIKKMPMGIHTVLSEDGGTISGGQQQKILIARALISDPKILIFDEATSALDNITQNMICDTIEKLDATRVVIAHRLSTIMKCDRIIVIDEGKIVEQGTFDELMQSEGMFCKMAKRQMA